MKIASNGITIKWKNYIFNTMHKPTTLLLFSFLFTLTCNAQTTEQINSDVTVKEMPYPAGNGQSVFTIVEEMPKYADGDQGMMKFLIANIHYPDSARLHDIEGTVYTSFIVNTDGKTIDHKIVRGIDPYLDAEALRVARLLTFESPGRQQGKAVRVQFTLPVKFKLQ